MNPVFLAENSLKNIPKNTDSQMKFIIIFFTKFLGVPHHLWRQGGVSKGRQREWRGAKVLKAFSILGFRVPTTCGGKVKGSIKGEQREQRGSKGSEGAEDKEGVNMGHFHTSFLGSPPPVGVGSEGERREQTGSEGSKGSKQETKGVNREQREQRGAKGAKSFLY